MKKLNANMSEKKNIKDIPTSKHIYVYIEK